MNYRGGMWEGAGGQDGVKGGKWDNCNSIINQYIYIFEITKKKKKKELAPGSLLRETAGLYPQNFWFIGLEQGLKYYLPNMFPR